MRNMLHPTPIPSTQISRIGYDEYDRVLLVEFKNTKQIYRYHDLMRGVYEKLMKAPSIGSFIAKEVVPNHYGEKVVSGIAPLEL